MIVETFSVCCSITLCTHYKKFNTFLIMYAAFFVKRNAEYSACIQIYKFTVHAYVYKYMHGTTIHEYSTCAQVYTYMCTAHVYMYSIQV